MYPKLLSKLLALSFLTLALIALSTGIYLSNPAPVQSQNKGTDIKLNNKTVSLMILGTEVDRSDNTITRVLLKNISNKAINGFYVTEGAQGKGDTFFTHIEFLFSDFKDEISPQEVFDFKASTAQLSQEDGFILHAVFFKDGSAEGETKYIREIQDTRQGEKVQLERGVQFVDQILSSQDKDSFDLKNIQQKLLASPTKEGSRSEYFNSGLVSGTAELKRNFEAIQKNWETKALPIKEELLKLKVKLEKVSSNM